jgi:cytoskeletal protein RodZ
VQAVSTARAPRERRIQPTGIGRALQKARLLRRKTIEEASRDTRIRPRYLMALEEERFELLMGDVYLRGALRSYSSYVGLNADKVLRLYTQHFGPPHGMLPQPSGVPSGRYGTTHTPAMLFRAAPTWAFLTGVALLVLAVLATLGLLSW